MGGSCRVGLTMRLESVAKSRTELSIVDRAANLKQEISTSSGPAHLLRFVHSPIDEKVCGSFCNRRIQQSLRAVGRTDDTEVTAFTDGCPGLRSILVDAGITTPPFLDWFHIAMRIQHAAQTAGGLPTDNPYRMHAKSVIVEEVERLRWRI